jgi:inosine-uridine nucleoside N-ribohydrolase
MSYNLIIDTDVGSDDAIAIALALQSDNAVIHAITTVFGNVSAEQSAINVATMLTLYGKVSDCILVAVPGCVYTHLSRSTFTPVAGYPLLPRNIQASCFRRHC